MGPCEPMPYPKPVRRARADDDSCLLRLMRWSPSLLLPFISRLHAAYVSPATAAVAPGDGHRYLILRIMASSPVDPLLIM